MPLRQEVAKLNALIEHIEDDLLLGVPIEIVSNDAGLTATGSYYFVEPGEYQLAQPWMKAKVWTSALLCGPDTIVIAAANHIPASQEPPQAIAPSRNVTVTVQLPPFLSNATAFEATEDGVSPYPCTVAGGQAVLKLDTIESGRIFLLRRK